MIFNSLTYILLLLLVVPLYWLLPVRQRLVLILVSSLTFYGFWRIEFIPLLLFSALLDYFVALRLNLYGERVRKILVTLCITINLGLLIYFKYLLFIANSFVDLFNLFNLGLDHFVFSIVLPLGISFYTFQTISYTIDVYRRVIDPEKDFIAYCCYVTFFPQLVAGPILRASEVLTQLKSNKRFSSEYISLGVSRILQGLFLKVVIADNISKLVDTGFAMPLDSMSAFDVWTLSFLFGFQIYFDFSAYSHIAIGSALLLGLRFPENFNFPYMAKSPKDFWKRWHISLSSWIRDYLYLPLMGVKGKATSEGGLAGIVSVKRKSGALFLTWAIMGLWHGASWNFLVWGVYHAAIIYTYRKFFMDKDFKFSPLNRLGNLVTLPLMMLSWIPFRAESLTDTFTMWSKVLNPAEYWGLGMRENVYLVTAMLLLCCYLCYWIRNLMASRNELSLAGTTLAYSFMIPLIIIFLRPINQYIYFQF